MNVKSFFRPGPQTGLAASPRKTARVLFIVFTLGILALYLFHLRMEYRQVRDMAARAAQAVSGQIAGMVEWQAERGGLYVREPGPGAGAAFVRVPCAHIIREMTKRQSPGSPLAVRMVSRTPLNPANGPDTWEAESLGRLSSGEPERFALARTEGGMFAFRYAAPVPWQAQCSSCHGANRGEAVPAALSITLAARPFLETGAVRLAFLTLGTVLVWVLGFMAIRFGRKVHERDIESVRDSEIRYRSFFEHSHAATLFIDPETTRVVDANPAACRFYGYDRPILKTLRISDINTMRPDEVLIDLEKAVTRSRNQFFFKHRLASGELRDVEVQSGPVMMGGRTILCSIVHDITELRAAQEALRQERDRARRYLDIAGVILMALDTESRVTLMNPAGCRILGREEKDILGKPWFDHFLGEARREEAWEFFRGFLAKGGTAPLYRENWVRGASGEERLMAWRHSVMRDADGTVLGTLSSGEDITEHRQAETALRESHRFLNFTLDALPQQVAILDESGAILAVNASWRDHWGASEADRAAVGADYLALAESAMGEDGATLAAGVREVMDGSRQNLMLECRREREGEARWYVVRVTRFTSEGPLRVVAAHMDVTARKTAEITLRESEERYALAARAARDGLFDWDIERGTVYYSPRWKTMVGCTEDDIGGTPEEWFNRVHPEDRPRLEAGILAHVRDVTPHFEEEYRMFHQDGRWLWMLARGIAVRGEGGRACRMAGSQTDITKRKEAERQLLRDALYDSLTGLPNRALFMDRLDRAIERRKRREAYIFAVLFVDMDRFKIVNDSLGHLAGDQLLVLIARRLEKCIRGGDTVARLGGDEFAILLDDVATVEDASAIAERIHTELAHPFRVGEKDVFTSASIGIALSGPGYSRPEELLRDADTAMYRAKALGKARHEVFDRTMHTRVVQLLQIETDLRRALDRGELLLHYQPVVSLETGEILGFEALCRWNHPDRGLVLPSEFIPVAEETGLIVPLGWWVLREACASMKAWQERHPRPVPLHVSVNLSVRQCSQSELAQKIAAVLKETGLPPACLSLEITESVIMENTETASSLLANLRALDIRLCIDDFGTGYSSLGYLHQFPLNTLKIDRSFVGRLDATGRHGESPQAKIIRAIITLAHHLDIEVVAEGAETPAQVAALREMRCESAQGYVFSRPVPAGEAERLIASGHRWDVTASHFGVTGAAPESPFDHTPEVVSCPKP